MRKEAESSEDSIMDFPHRGGRQFLASLSFVPASPLTRFSIKLNVILFGAGVFEPLRIHLTLFNLTSKAHGRTKTFLGVEASVFLEVAAGKMPRRALGIMNAGKIALGSRENLENRYTPRA